MLFIQNFWWLWLAMVIFFGGLAVAVPKNKTGRNVIGIARVLVGIALIPLLLAILAYYTSFTLDVTLGEFVYKYDTYIQFTLITSSLLLACVSICLAALSI